MAALAEKAWRRPGSDLSDWFNYGFDELSWEAYCYRRRELGDLAAVLKTNVVVRGGARRRFFFYYCESVSLMRESFVELFWHA